MISGLIRAIQQDVHQGIKGLLQIPGQISDAITGLDATFYRLWQQIRPQNIDDAHSNINYGAQVYTTAVGAALSSAISGAIKNAQQVTTYASSDHLSDPSIGTIGGDVVSCLRNIVTTSVNTMKDMLQTYITPGEVPEDFWSKFSTYWFTETANLIVGLVSAFGVMLPVIDFAKQQANKCIPIQTLSPGNIVEAAIRGFVDDATYQEELRRQGLDATRAKLLRDLGTHRVNIGDLVDYVYRGIIADSDFARGMADWGVTATQTQAYKEAGAHVPTVDETLLWLKRGIIGTDDATTLIQQLHYRAEHAQAVLGTYMQFVPTNLRSSLQGLLDATDLGWLRDTMLRPIPDEVSQAAVRDGIEPGYARLLWQNHWSLPRYTQVIESYFRQMRTYNEVIQSMTSENIPVEFQDDLVQIARPLIPYRSIPSFVKAGAMSLADANIELARHGFDAQHISWVLHLLGTTKSTTNATAATQAKSISIRTAAILFADGAITEDQYVAILIQHGYTPDLAKTTADVEAIADHAKKRKQEIADQLAEVVAGVIDLNTALNNLNSFGATQAEIAKFEVQVAKSLRTAAKHPTEAELTKFAKAQLITQAQYRTELGVQGWSPQWVDAFAALLYSSPTAQYPGQ